MNSDEYHFRADLHCHSTCSDGTSTPLELLELAKERGLSGLSITDHDTISAYTPEIFSKAKELGIILLTGVEFSCRHKNENIHVLGYGLDVTLKSLKEFCDIHIKNRYERNKTMVELLQKRGFKISIDELYTDGLDKCIGRPHIANLLLSKGYIRNIKDAFQDLIGDGKSCYSPSACISIEETIDVIRASKGKAFLAHPHLYKNRKVLKDVLKQDFDGVECYYAKCALEVERKWIKWANEHDKLISGGSDFHGTIKPYLSLGRSWVDRETFDLIYV